MQRVIDFQTTGILAGANVSDEVRMTDNAISIQLTAVNATGGAVLEISNDNTNWATAQVKTAGNPGSAYISAMVATGIYIAQVQARFWRLRNAGATTAQGTIAVGEGWIN